MQEAKNNQAAADQKVTEIEALIVQLKAEVELTRQAAELASAEQHAAEQQLEAAQQRLDTLEVQAEASQAEAEEAAKQAATIVSQLYRSGGVDRNLDLFLESDDESADALLDRLARMEKATERNSSISDKAEQAMNSAHTLGDQAESARNERDRLHDDAVAKAEAAAIAADAALTRQQEQEAQLEVLETQLAALKDTTTKTVAGYEERLVLEREERERLAREAAQNAGSGGGGGGGGGVSSSGWTNPLGGGYWISAEWWGYSGHRGIDMAIGSWTPIYAASSGTVTYAGWNGDYGNVVYIDHGGGLSTRYAHQIQVSVSRGQWVEVGQHIGYVGSTGYSTGPHLHFETLVWGEKTTPRPFMNARGIWL
ncbi:MAG: peptidoglycan DD-metalloendopeptidase family protein [Leucobacter sp.]|nr:peptidoglycan DD-metalloendopeptidase family protein [Leucobacter sp.]